MTNRPAGQGTQVSPSAASALMSLQSCSIASDKQMDQDLGGAPLTADVPGPEGAGPAVVDALLFPWDTPVGSGPETEGPDGEGPVAEGPVAEGPVAEGPVAPGLGVEPDGRLARRITRATANQSDGSCIVAVKEVAETLNVERVPMILTRRARPPSAPR